MRLSESLLAIGPGVGTRGRPREPNLPVLFPPTAPGSRRKRATHRKAPLCRAFGARPTGFEPVTFGSVDRRSIQLSYGRLRASEDSGRAVTVAVRGASGEGGIRTRDGT